MNSGTRTNHEIDYLTRGEEMQCVEIELEPSETAVEKDYFLLHFVVLAKFGYNHYRSAGLPVEFLLMELISVKKKEACWED